MAPCLAPSRTKLWMFVRGHAEVGQNAAPVADAGTDEELVAGFGERNDLVLEARPVAVAPGEHDRCLWGSGRAGRDAGG